MGAPTSADMRETRRLRDFALAAAIFAGSLGASSVLQILTGWTFLMVPVAAIVGTGLVAGRSAALASLVAHAIAYVLLYGGSAFGVGELARWRIIVFVGVGAFVALVAGSVRAASRRLATERRAAHLATARAEASEERFRRIAENAPDVVYRYRLSPDPAFEYLSPATTRLTGYTPEEHYRDPGLAPRLVVPEDLPALRLASAVGDGAEPLMLRLRRRDGTIVWTEQRIVVLRDEAGVAVALEGIARDVTARIEAERAREAFVSIASHELRTPLAALVLQLGLLRRGAGENSELLRRVDSCDRQAHRLEGLVSTLLDASRVRPGQLPLARRPVDLAPIVRAAVERLSARLAEARCAVSVDVASVAGAYDPGRIDQLVASLVANAAEHAPGAPVHVTLRPRSGGAVLEIRDHGPGIPPDLRERVFERFERGPRRVPGAGLGLGLFLVRRIAEAHGGAARVEPPVDGGPGARIVVELVSGQA